ncbi:MotE family protein [Bosea thiooxidans]
MIERPRLLPAVILGAMALLALKLLAWTGETGSNPNPPEPETTASLAAAKPPAGKSTSGKPSVSTAKSEPDVWGLAKIIARAHAPDFFDPETTGSTPAPDPKKEQEKKEAEAKAEAARAADPNNKAGLLNGTARAVSPAEKAILERLGERRQELESRMRELEIRERLLDTAEKRLDGRAGDLKAIEEKNSTAAPKPAVEEAKAIKNLVIMYEAMKPKDAARVFDRLGLEVLVPVVQQMNPRKMSEVLAAMAPERAEKLTVALATSSRAQQPERIAAEVPLPSNELPAIAPVPQR